MNHRATRRDASRNAESIIICVSDAMVETVTMALASQPTNGGDAVLVTGLLETGGDRQYIAVAHRLAYTVDRTLAAALAGPNHRFDEIHVVGPVHSTTSVVRRLRAAGDLHPHGSWCMRLETQLGAPTTTSTSSTKSSPAP